MKRDDDFIRQFLLEAEESKFPYLMAPLVLSPAPDDLKRHQHAELLVDAGMFQPVNKGVYRMTNNGHDYLNAIRDDTVWNKTKDGAAQFGGVTLGIMKDMAVAYLKQEISGKLGISL
jgi:hypothetical protein